MPRGSNWLPCATVCSPPRPASASQILQRNLLVYGLGGVLVPFVGIKAIDMAVSALHLA